MELDDIELLVRDDLQDFSDLLQKPNAPLVFSSFGEEHNNDPKQLLRDLSRPPDGLGQRHKEP